jgi:hypothetical protein
VTKADEGPALVLSVANTNLSNHETKPFRTPEIIHDDVTVAVAL